MKKLLGALMALVLVVAACGDDDAADPASLDSCDAVAAAGIDLLQDTLQTIDDLDEAEAAAALQAEEEPEFLAELETRGNALEARAAEIGCTNEQIAEIMAGSLGDLSADSTIGQLFLGLMQEAVQTGELFGDG